MAQPIVSDFSSFSLSPDEEESGQILSELQKMVIQNKRTVIVSEKMRLLFDPYKPLEFTQQEAYLRGQMDVLSWLLDTSAEVEELIKARAAQPK